MTEGEPIATQRLVQCTFTLAAAADVFAACSNPVLWYQLL